MANPQTEKGFTRIANEILTKIYKTKQLNGTQLKILLCIWRWTYGFQRKSHEMPATFIATDIESNKRQVKRELDVLLNRRIVLWIGMGTKGGKVLKFNKNYDEWQDYNPEKSEQQHPEDERSEEEDQLKEEDIEPIPQKKPKQTKKKKYDENNTYYKMALYFHGLVSKVAEEAGVLHLIKKVNLQSWADEFRKLIELDKVDKRQAKELMDWVTQDDFWKLNILSASKLRKQYLQLSIKMASSKPNHPVKQKKIYDYRDREIAFNKWVSAGNDPEAFKWEGDDD